MTPLAQTIQRLFITTGEIEVLKYLYYPRPNEESWAWWQEQLDRELP